MSFYVNPHQHQCPWYPHAEMLGAPNIKWCEETLCQWISEPANTWSNIAYLIAALYIFWSASKKRYIELNLFAPIMFVLGSASFIYHMSNNYLSQVFDFIGMFILVYWLFVINLKRLGVIERKQYLPIMGGLIAISLVILHLMYLSFLKYQYIILFNVVMIAVTEYLNFKKSSNSSENNSLDNKSLSEHPTSYRHFFIGFTLIFLAKIFSLLDGMRVMCDPTNHWFQGHAMWHLLGAIALTFIYKHYEQFDFAPNLYCEEIETQLEV